ncbi:MAG: polyprenyl synthetase family protein [Candidatus Sumerlaeia bacterium]|nr:polyprenyl synthetase family protein [Candidatus Sumerlaeia bacterium]
MPSPDFRSPIQSLVEQYLPLINERLVQLIQREEQIPNLHEGVLYSLGLDDPAADGGKRLRPVLCLASADALGVDVRQALPFACAIELMHNFALVHDDIEDGDVSRRNRPSTYIRYGLAHGVNIGDYLLCKVLSSLLDQPEIPAEKRLQLLQLMSTTLDHTHYGQALDISARQQRHFTREEYYRLVREKTGYYLAAPILGAAFLADSPTELRAAIQRYGEYIGPLFQITDDVLDLTSGKGRNGVIGNDLREGKRSYLVAATCDRATPSQVERLFDILDAPREETTDAMIAEAVQLFTECGALEDAQQEANSLLEKGLATLRALPAPLEALLKQFATSLVDRKR